jgi:galactose mutarotase-like enzyme
VAKIGILSKRKNQIAPYFHFLWLMENEYLSIVIQNKGAEITSILDKKTRFEYLWQADKTIWGRHAPVLFPIVGKVKHNQLLIDGTPFPMNQHGFARDEEFTLVSSSNTEQWYELTHTNLSLFPYPFQLLLGYTLSKNTLHCHYKVINTGNQNIYFSIGAHPGFNLPTQKLSDYQIQFSLPENEERQLLTDGLFDGSSKKIFTTPTQIQLSKAIFDDDAIVFKSIRSTKIILKQLDGPFAITLNFEGFPQLGIWTQKNCEHYICLEPWCGHSDSINGHEDISLKEGIMTLEAGKTLERTYSLMFNS